MNTDKQNPLDQIVRTVLARLAGERGLVCIAEEVRRQARAEHVRVSGQNVMGRITTVWAENFKSYLSTLPTSIPPGLVLVHNQVRRTRRLGSRGFRAWWFAPDAPRLEECCCGWAPELGRHFRVRPTTEVAAK
jgi:hypothetical protein